MGNFDLSQITTYFSRWRSCCQNYARYVSIISNHPWTSRSSFSCRSWAS